MAKQTDTYIADTNKTANNYQYTQLDKDDKRQNMSDRENIEWKVNFNNSKSIIT